MRNVKYCRREAKYNVGLRNHNESKARWWHALLIVCEIVKK
jgi:hypothetical protein